MHNVCDSRESGQYFNGLEAHALFYSPIACIMYVTEPSFIHAYCVSDTVLEVCTEYNQVDHGVNILLSTVAYPIMA